MSATSYMWTGGLTHTGFSVIAKTTPGTSVRLATQAGASLTAPTYAAAVTADANGYAQLTAAGLTANTGYTYGIEEAGTLNAMRGSVRTMPTPGAPASFTFAHGSCAFSGSGHPVFTKIQDKAPLFLAHLGDLHYENIATNDQSLYRAAYDNYHVQNAPNDMHRNVPTAYMWDDHDFGPDNSDGTGPYVPAAQATYRQCVPHYPLTDAAGTWQTWKVGRVVFILTDLRSFRSPDSDVDSASKTQMGATQKAWFKQTMLDAKNNGAKMIVWFSTGVYKSLGTSGIWGDADQWSGYATERTELADFIKANGLTPLVKVVSGDQHCLAYDDGTHADFATGGGAAIPEFSASAFHQTGGSRGNNWTGGPVPNVASAGHYGLFTVNDDGTNVSYLWRGMKVSLDGATETEVMRFDSTATRAIPAGMVQRPTMVWNGSTWVSSQPLVWNGSAWVPQPALVTN